MPTDLLAAMERKAKIAAEQRQDLCCGVLLIPVIMTISTIIAAILSPSFAAALSAIDVY